MPNQFDFDKLFNNRPYSRDQVLVERNPIPMCSGIYAWFFKEIPPNIITDRCSKNYDLTLLYVGISPKSINSHQTIRDRIKFHFTGDAGSSTLRFTLGCLLSNVLGIKLRLVGDNQRKIFCVGETRRGEDILSEWMRENAFVSWVHIEEPWLVERNIIANTFLPLNLQHNQQNINYLTVSQIRMQANIIAQTLPPILR